MLPRRPRWCVFISGRGSNLSAFMDTPGVDVKLVVSSDSMAPGVWKARRAGVPVFISPRTTSAKPSLDWFAIDQELRRHQIDCIFLLGFMRIVPPSFIANWENRILNLHPSLLPAYPGLKSIERAKEDGADCGVSIHQVVAEVDAGKVLRQRQSLGGFLARSFSLQAVERLVSVDEQRAVREVGERWRIS